MYWILLTLALAAYICKWCVFGTRWIALLASTVSGDFTSSDIAIQARARLTIPGRLRFETLFVRFRPALGVYHLGQRLLIYRSGRSCAAHFRSGHLQCTSRQRPSGRLRSSRFVGDFVYELPFRLFSDSNSLLVRNLLHGWQISGIYTAQSGAPTNITQDTGFEGSRADYIGGDPILTDYRTTLRYLDKTPSLVPIGQQSGVPCKIRSLGRGGSACQPGALALMPVG